MVSSRILIIKDNRDTTPFRRLTEDEISYSRARNFNEIEIEAIFVFADSRDWAGDQQIILDLLTSKNGRLGTRSETFQEGPPIFFSHNDVVWSTFHKLTRIGMGALRASLEATYKAVAGIETDNDRVWETSDWHIPIRHSPPAAMAEGAARDQLPSGYRLLCWRHARIGYPGHE